MLRRVNGGLLAVTIAITVFGWGPLAGSYLAEWVARANGCLLDEGGTHACIIAGHDFGEILGNLWFMGWLTVIAFPFTLASIVLWIVVLVQIVWLRDD